MATRRRKNYSDTHEENFVSRNSLALRFRPDVIYAHTQLFLHLANPGDWLSAHEKIMIAKECRAAYDCTDCSIDCSNVIESKDLCSVLVNVVHVIVNSLHKIDKVWYDNMIINLTNINDNDKRIVPEAMYAECVAIASSIVGIDTVFKGLDMPLKAIPDTWDKRPAIRPEFNTFGQIETSSLSWIPYVRPCNSSGNTKQKLISLYELASENQLKKKNDITIGCAYSIAPKFLDQLANLSKSWYVNFPMVLQIHAVPKDRVLDRSQIEFIAKEVSLLRGCTYCINIHDTLLLRELEECDVYGEKLLKEFIHAVHSRDRERIILARDALMADSQIGHSGAVEIASVTGHFHMMTRTANSVGLWAPREYWTKLRKVVLWQRRKIEFISFMKIFIMILVVLFILFQIILL